MSRFLDGWFREPHAYVVLACPEAKRSLFQMITSLLRTGTHLWRLHHNVLLFVLLSDILEVRKWWILC